MAKLPTFVKIDENAIADAPKGNWIEGLKAPINDILSSSNTLFQGGLTFAQNISSEIKQLSLSIPDPWQPLTLVNSYVNYNNGYETAQIMKNSDGMTCIKGMVNGGSADIVTTIPDIYRPSQHYISATNANSSHAQLVVASSGEIYSSTHTLASIRCTFLSADPKPQILSCFPLIFSTKFKDRPLAVVLIECSDSDTSANIALGGVCLPDWSYAVVSGAPSIKINNLCGLPYNRKVSLKFLILGG